MTTTSSHYSRNSSFDMQLKLLTIGNAGVGKTCLMLRYTNNEFTSSYLSTVGVDFHIKTVELQGKKIRVQIWDTAGHERFRTITTSFFRGAQGILLVYDIMDRGSLASIPSWIQDVQKSPTGSNVKMILVGNKADIASSARAITRAEGEAIAAQYGIDFYETSAKDNTNVDTAFMNLITQVYTAQIDQNSKQQNISTTASVDDNKITKTQNTSSSKLGKKESITIKEEKESGKKKTCCF